MSAAFKNAKKKQSELRKCMKDHKEKAQKVVKKIDSPLAKYNESGQLICILCKSIVRSDAVWTIHINAKQHKQNVEQAKKLKLQTNNFTTSLKRPLTPPLEVPTKKTKSILKNAPNVTYKSNIIVVSGDNVKETKNEDKPNLSGVPTDFFDSAAKKPVLKELRRKQDEKMDIAEDPPTEAIPEGFFDDPKLDAKARNIEYKDPIEEEWDKFQKEIKDANHESAAIIAEDQDEATNERQIDEIEEQMKNWSRVLHLEKKKVEIISNLKEDNTKMDEDESGSEDENFDEFLDWRAKKAYK